MNSISKVVGKRLRNYRKLLGLSQEKLAEKAGVHQTYIGQLERGEKNATIESIEAVADALGVPLETLFEKMSQGEVISDFPSQAYELIQGCPLKKQEKLIGIIKEIMSLQE